jgi:nucleoside-diphosphate-sugar epimerase
VIRIVVVGGRGYLGRWIAARLGPGALVPGRAELDLAAGPAAVARALRAAAPDAVVNCAGATHGTPAELAAANVTGTACLLAAMRAACPDASLVHLGSAAEYGPDRPGRATAETGEPAPAGAYGRTKLAGTELVRAAGIRATVLRVFNPVGPGAPPHSLPGRLAAEIARVRGEGGPVRLGPLDGYRDFVHGGPEVVNVGSGTATPIREFVRTVLASAGVDAPVTESGPGSARSAPVTWQQADVALAAAAWGWRPRISLAGSAAALAGAAELAS